MRFVKGSIVYGDAKSAVEGYVNIDEALTIEPHGPDLTKVHFIHCFALVRLPFDKFIEEVKGEDFSKKKG